MKKIIIILLIIITALYFSNRLGYFNSTNNQKLDDYEQKIYSICEDTGGVIIDCPPCDTPGTCVPCEYCECSTEEIFSIEHGCRSIDVGSV